MTSISLHRWTMVVLLLLVPVTGASAQWVDAWSYDFATHQHESFSGNDGWQGAWSGDNWTTAAYEGELNPLTDEGGGNWGTDAAISNAMVQEQEGPWTDVAVETQFAALDDDSLGLVFRAGSDDTFYLFLMTHSLRPSEGAGGNGEYGDGSYLYRVQNGQAQVVAQNKASYRVDDGNNWAYQRLRVEMVGDTFTAYYGDDPKGAWDNSTKIMSWTDNSPLPGGQVGVYTYEMGEGQILVGFKEFKVQVPDGGGDDDDDASDDDASDDDASDDDASDDDAAGDDDAADDDAAGDDDAADDDGGDDDGLEIGSGCDCQSQIAPLAGSGLVSFFGLMGLFAALLRRR